MRWTGVAAFVTGVSLAIAALAPLPAQAQTFDQITVSHPNSSTTLFRIDRPNPTRPTTPYPSIRFQPGDEILVTAGGCVQTGGWGRTWKSYTNPQGSSADHLYSGTIYIPGVIPLGADNGYPRIGGWINKTLRVPPNVPPAVQSELFLHLGYQDDGYGDNSYQAHDDGNNDQCKNIGAAFVIVKVTHPTAPVAEWTPRSRPFDLSWRTDNIDGNGLPVNGFWGGQFNPQKPFGSDPEAGRTPDFVKSCGPAFSWNWLHHGMDENLTALNATCTSQAPTTDFDHSAFVEPCCYCHPQPLSGHLDWTYGTYTGEVTFEAYSGNWPEDGDLNFDLASTGGAGLTDQNSGTVHMEMEGSETVDNFRSPFWQTIRTEAEPQGLANAGWGATNPDGEKLIHKQIDGKVAVVTGLVGIDGVHGGATEIHPITAMAICISGCTQVQGDNPGSFMVEGADQTWVFFIQNFGRGGECSSSEHFWPGLNPQNKKSWYFLTLPWPEGATSVQTLSPVLKASGSLNTADAARWKNWTVMGFELPDPTDGSAPASVDGQFTLHYAFGGPPHHRAPVKAAAMVAAKDDEGGADFRSLYARITDPAQRAKLDQLIQSTPPIRAKPRPHVTDLVLARHPGAAAALATVTPAKAAKLTPDHPYIDPDLQTRQQVFMQQAVKLVPVQAVSPAALVPLRAPAAVTPELQPKPAQVKAAPEAAPHE